MPDTGAPWNIPYVAGTDLVSDWPTDSQDLANAIASGLDAAGNAGIGSNIVQTVKTDTFSTTSATYTPVTGLTVTITPTSATSKVLLLAFLNIDASQAVSKATAVRFAGGNAGTFVGDASSTKFRAAFGFDSFAGKQQGAGLTYLDSPATTSATTYSIEVATNTAGTIYVNRSVTDPSSDGVRTASSIVAIEVAA